MVRYLPNAYIVCAPRTLFEAHELERQDNTTPCKAIKCVHSELQMQNPTNAQAVGLLKYIRSVFVAYTNIGSVQNVTCLARTLPTWN